MVKEPETSFSNLMFLIESAIIEYELMYEESKLGFLVRAIRCLIKLPDLSMNNKYFIVINDTSGSHCTDWIIAYEFVRERFDYWLRFLELGHRDVIEYSFPDILPFRKWTLKSNS